MKIPLDNLKDKKIVIMGLDNSGKTSILLSLKEQTNLLDYLSLKPTKGLKIETIKTAQENMIIWEFGGQEQYRKEYLENFKEYFDETNYIIYVIDVQDIARYDLCLNYFKDIMNLLNENNIFVDISIFFHKYDPNLTKRDEFKEIDKIVINKLLYKIKELVPTSYNCKFYKTTIYTIFEKFLIM